MGAERKIVQKNAVFRGKRHDNKILNVQILLSRNFVVIAQAPILRRGTKSLPKVNHLPPGQTRFAPVQPHRAPVPQEVFAPMSAKTSCALSKALWARSAQKMPKLYLKKLQVSCENLSCRGDGKSQVWPSSGRKAEQSTQDPLTPLYPHLVFWVVGFRRQRIFLQGLTIWNLFSYAYTSSPLKKLLTQKKILRNYFRGDCDTFA